MGIEPTSSAWEAEVLPLNYTRFSCCTDSGVTPGRHFGGPLKLGRHRAALLKRPCQRRVNCKPAYALVPQSRGKSALVPRISVELSSRQLGR